METYSTAKPINLLLKCFALNCILKKDDVIISSWSLTKNVLIMLILSCINAGALYFKILETDHSGKGFTQTDAVRYEFLLGFFKYMIDLIYVRIYGTTKCVSYYCAYDKIDNILKMSYYTKIKMTIVKTTMTTCTFCIAAYVLNIIAWVNEDPYDYGNISYLFGHFYTLTQVLTVLDIASSVVQIEYRLRALGDRVGEFNKNNKNNSAFVTKSRNNKLEVSRLDRLKIVDETCLRRPDDILTLCQCYLKLIQQTDFINDLFGFRVSILPQGAIYFNLYICNYFLSFVLVYLCKIIFKS